MCNFFQFNTTDNYPIKLEICENKNQHKIFRETIDKYHSYVKFNTPPQRRINYLIYETENGNLLGTIGLSSCVLALSTRDKWIGWTNEQKYKNHNSVANNYRFCIIGGNSSLKNVGSMSLSQLIKFGKIDWEKKYGNKLHLIETLVQPSRETDKFESQYKNERTGCVYKASGWKELNGLTKGNSIKRSPVSLWKREDGERGFLARTDPIEAIKKYGANVYAGGGVNGYLIEKSHPKMIFLKPITKNFRNVLCKD